MDARGLAALLSGGETITGRRTIRNHENYNEIYYMIKHIMIYIKIVEFHRKTDPCLSIILNIHVIHSYILKLAYHIN